MVTTSLELGNIVYKIQTSCRVQEKNTRTTENVHLASSDVFEKIKTLTATIRTGNLNSYTAKYAHLKEERRKLHKISTILDRADEWQNKNNGNLPS